MISRIGFVVVAATTICCAIPAGAEEVGIGVGPVGVTVGSGPPRERVIHEREVIRERDHRPDKTVIIKKDREHHHHHDGRTVVIEHDHD